MRLVAAIAIACVCVAVAPPGAASASAPAWQAGPGVEDARLRCTTVTVPLDHARPGGRTIEITVSRLPATDPALRGHHVPGGRPAAGGGPGLLGPR